jgi:tetratricopeptide (TPR) repeat protein
LKVAEAIASLEMAVSDRTLSPDELQRRTLLSVLVMEDLLKIVLDYGTPADAELLKTRIRDSYQQIIDAKPELAAERQLMQVRFLVLAGERPRAVEVLKQHWQQAGIDTLVIACGSLLNFPDELKKLERAGAAGKLPNEEVQRQKKELLTSVGEAELITQQALVKTQQELAALAAATDSDVAKFTKVNEVITLLSLLGDHYLATKRYDEAMQTYTQILALDPGNIVALNNRAMIMAGTKTNLPEALAQIDAALKRVGPVPLIVDSRAMVLHASGKYAEALEAAQQVIKEAPEKLDPVRNPDLAKNWGGYYFHRALMYQALKDPTSAAADMQKARELGFGESDVSDLEMGLWKEISGM